MRAVVLVLLAACAGDDRRLPRPIPRAAAPLTQPARLCVTEQPLRPCRAPAEVEAWLARPDLEIAGAAEAPAGIQGARVLTLRARGAPGVVFRAKWRAHATATSDNSPRRELAAHAVQKLFLEPHEWVVPPAAAACFPLDEYRRTVDARAVATFDGTACVYGVLSYWLEAVETLPEAEAAQRFDFEDDGLLDDRLYRTSATFRDSIGALNLVTHLIDHADTHWKQFLIGRDRARPIIYSVDNSMSFGARKNRRVRQDWSQIRVPAVPRVMVDRLRGAAGRLDNLAAIAELEPRGDRLVLVPRAGDLVPGDVGVRRVGRRVRVGLTKRELAELEARVEALLAAVDGGRMRVY